MPIGIRLDDGHQLVISRFVLHPTRIVAECPQIDVGDGGGEEVEVETLWWTPDAQPSPLIKTLSQDCGVELDADGFIKTDENQKTNVEGLWAAGDVAGSSGALAAAAGGAKAAQTIVKGWFG